MPKLNNQRRAILVFRVAAQQYALDLSHVEQIVAMAELDRPPGAPPLLAGFLNLAGTPLPVVRVYHLFNLPELPLGLWTPLIILESSGGRLALLVDSVTGIIPVHEDDVLPLPNHHVVNDCVTGIVRWEEESLLLLSPERLLLENESRAVAELQEMVRHRIGELQGAEA